MPKLSVILPAKILRGEYISFFDDDEWLPSKLAKKLEVMEKGTHNRGGLRPKLSISIYL